MEQSTNSSASRRLQPNRSNGIGNIVEEHIRYWRKFDDAKIATEKAKKAREEQFKSKINSKTLELYSGLTPEENKGFLNSQIIELYESKKDELLELSRKSAEGDANAILKYQNYKNNFKKLASINKVYGEKAIANSKDSDNFNPFLDNGIKKFQDATSKGMYKLNDDFSLSVIVEGKEPLKINPSQLFDNEYLTSTYSGKPKFDEYGEEIAKLVLNNNDGNKEITEKTKLKAISQIKSIFEKDNVEARSAYASYLQEKNIDPKKQKRFDQLSSIEKTIIAEDYYNKNVFDRIQQVTKNENLEDQIKRERLRGQRLENTKKTKQIQKLDNTSDDDGNSLRITVDGIKVGDKKYVKSLNNQKLEEQGSDGKDIYIRESEFVDGKLVLKLSNGDIKEIDSANDGQFTAEVLKLIRPNDKADKRLEEYEKGVSNVNYNKSTSNKSDIKLEEEIKKTVDSFNDKNKSDKIVPKLQSIGFEGFEDKGGVFGNEVLMPNGETVNVNTITGTSRLKKYLLDNWKSIKKSSKEQKLDIFGNPI